VLPLLYITDKTAVDDAMPLLSMDMPVTPSPVIFVNAIYISPKRDDPYAYA
jgi:hypothetical protein